jgi:preprotein translocase subunit SecD
MMAIMSLVGWTLTMPGIAGIVLTLGIAVDANVLIFARIREEIENGMSIPRAINAGYEKAFVTIVDANVTTLIVSVILFAIGTGPVKGFAVTLTLGILTSMFTAIMYSRAIINLMYGGNNVKSISIGTNIHLVADAAVHE